MYHTVQPYLASWDVNRNVSWWEDMETWCTDRFGKAGDVWDETSSRWYLNAGTIWFRDEQDQTLFVLRWL